MLCPLLSVCGKAVGLKEYVDVCSNMTADNYLNCPHYKEQTKEPKRPADWAKLLTHTSIP